MKRSPPTTIRDTGTPPGSRLIGISPINKGMLVDVHAIQMPGLIRLDGKITLIAAGQGTYARWLEPLTGTRFKSAKDLIVSVRHEGARSCTHIVDCRLLGIAHEAVLPLEALNASSSNSLLRYDVALSFAGEDRAVVREFADLLRTRNISVFYDEYERASLWGKDLYQHLSKVYSEYSRFCVIFVSGFYVKKLWAKHELRQAQARAFRESREYILPVRLDDAQLPGLPETIGYIDARILSLEVVATAVAEKLEDNSAPGETSSGASQLDSVGGELRDSRARVFFNNGWDGFNKDTDEDVLFTLPLTAPLTYVEDISILREYKPEVYQASERGLSVSPIRVTDPYRDEASVHVCFGSTSNNSQSEEGYYYFFDSYKPGAPGMRIIELDGGNEAAWEWSVSIPASWLQKSRPFLNSHGVNMLCALLDSWIFAHNAELDRIRRAATEE